MSDLSRLRWRCRRGVREMDILFQGFLTSCYPALDMDQQRMFEALLNEADLDILAWIMGKSEPDNPAYRGLIEQMQNLSESARLHSAP